MARMKKINFKSKKTWKNILVIGLACITLIGAIVGLSALFRKSEETTKEITPTYAVGGLTETGSYLETDASLYTKDAFGCIGLNVNIAFDNNVSYRVFFYNEDGKFLSATEKMTENYTDETPVYATQCRLVITPNDDQKISWYEKNGYTNQLTIKVDKDQTYVAKLRTITFNASDFEQANFVGDFLLENVTTTITYRAILSDYVMVKGTDLVVHNDSNDVYTWKVGIFNGVPSANNTTIYGSGFISDAESTLVGDRIDDVDTWYLAFGFEKTDQTELTATDYATLANDFYITLYA